MSKKFLLLLTFILCVRGVNSQDITFEKDSLIKRFYSILREYNNTSPFIDTTEYENNYPEALNTNLFIASSKGYCTEIPRFLIKGANINAISSELATPLHYAVSGGQLRSAEILLILGANRQAVDIFGNTPLLLAAEQGNIDMGELLIRYGASTEDSDSRGIVPLHKAVMNDDFYFTDMLLYYNANPDKQDNDGNTPLMYAVYNNNFEIADILLQNGANPDLTDNKGFTAFMIAAQKADTLMLSLLRKSKADIYKINSYGYDALCLAVSYGRKDIVKYLLREGNLWFDEKNDRVDIVPLLNNYDYDLSEFPPEIKKRLRESLLRNNQVSLFAGAGATNHLAFLSSGINLRNANLKGGLFLSCNFMPKGSRVLTETPSAVYQYRMRFSTFEAGLFKELINWRNNSSGTYKAYVSLSGAYKMYSYYYGTEAKAQNRFCLVPSAGIQLGFKYWSSGVEAGYMKTPFLKMSPVWIRLKLAVNLFSDRSTLPGKKIKTSLS